MPQQIDVKVKAADKDGMTFGELRAFVTAAMKNNADDSSVVGGQATFGGKLRQITVAAGGEA